MNVRKSILLRELSVNSLAMITIGVPMDIARLLTPVDLGAYSYSLGWC